MAMLVALPAGAQTALVVGAVRDQRGAAIAGASVEGRRPGGASTRTLTDDSGTFSIAGEDIASVLVTCRYCEPRVVSVRPGEPVVAIVRRYEALAGDSPTNADLENLPYAHVESALGLHPFALLASSTTPYPGSSLSDRGLSPSGSLLIDAGVPNYDIVAGSSPYGFIPSQYERSAVFSDPSSAFFYGNQAAGGIVTATPFANGSNWQVATLGSDAIGRAQIGTQSLGAVLGSYSNDEESRQRGDLFTSWPLGDDQSLSLAAGSEQGRTFGTPATEFGGSFSFTDATYADAQLANLYLYAALDRGNYALREDGYSAAAAWSDSSFSLGVHSAGAVSTFADLGIRASTGLYDQEAASYALPGIGATLAQTRADAGVKATGNDYVVTAGVGAFWIDYAGGESGVSQPAKASLAVPSLKALLFPNSRWSVDLQGGGSFTLPTFLQQYSYAGGYPASVEYERNGLVAGTLSYTDLSRLRFSVEQASQRVTGASSGTIVSSGFSAIWQIAPSLALRAWTMHVTDTVAPYGAAVSVYDPSVAPSLNALWLTYEANTGLRFDAIYRRDLLDGSPFYHVDGDISGPIAAGLRWYAGVEDRMYRTFVDVGLRFGGQ
jgi:hypothetical protein